MARKKATIPTTVLQLPEECDPKSITLDGDNIVVSHTGPDLSGSVVRFSHEGGWAYKIEWVEK